MRPTLRALAGKLPIKTSPHVEEWAKMREMKEFDFVWTPKNVVINLVVCVGIPLTMYHTIKNEFVRGLSNPRVAPRPSPPSPPSRNSPTTPTTENAERRV